MSKNIKRLSLLFSLISFFFIAEIQDLDALPPSKKINILKEGYINFNEPFGGWIIENEELILNSENPRESRTNIWLKENYGNFIIELNFKLNPGTNSGLFFRTADTGNPVQTGIEVQIRDDFNKSPIDKNFCGSIYDIREVSENRVKKAGKWNHLKVICNGSVIQVFLNKGKVVDINLTEWKDTGKNPDGTKNKFNTAYKDMPREGRIGFQDHGGKVWYKNIRISRL
jgi:hypothetical protein